MSQLMHYPRILVKQRLTMMVNRFEVYAADAQTGAQGALLAFAEQKRFAFKEQVTFFTDQSKSRAVFSFKARNVMELNGQYDITDEAGQTIGYFRKDFGQSLFRSTFHVEAPGCAGTGQERSMALALLRRFADLPLPIHFDYTDTSGAPLLSIVRQFALRDQYDVTIPNPNVDFRVAAALTVAMDVLMDR